MPFGKRNLSVQSKNGSLRDGSSVRAHRGTAAVIWVIILAISFIYIVFLMPLAYRRWGHDQDIREILFRVNPVFFFMLPYGFSNMSQRVRRSQFMRLMRAETDGINGRAGSARMVLEILYYTAAIVICAFIVDLCAALIILGRLI